MEPVFFVTGKQLEHGATDLERRQIAANWIASPRIPGSHEPLLIVFGAN